MTKLTASSAEEMPALDGVRALCSMWIVVFHSLCFTAVFYPRAEFEAWWHAPQLVILRNGFSAVDIFFVLTGYLLAYPLVKAGANLDPKTISLKSYYYKRFVQRILPAYVVVIVVYTAWHFRDNCMYPLSLVASNGVPDFLRKVLGNETSCVPADIEKTWGNVLFINNFFPLGGVLSHTWSLAVQGQFYFWLPIIVKWIGNRRKLLVATVVGVFAHAAFRYWVLTLAHDGQAPRPTYPYEEPDVMEFLKWYNIYYSLTPMRAGALLTGVLWAFAQAKLDRTLLSKLQSSWLLALLPVAMAPVIYAHFVYDPSHWRLALFDIGGTVWVLAATIYLFLIVNQIGFIAVGLNKLLSARYWKIFSDLSYALFLVHPVIQIKIFAALTPLSSDWLSIARNSSITILVSYACAVPLHFLVEKPAAQWLGSLYGSASPRTDAKLVASSEQQQRTKAE